MREGYKMTELGEIPFAWGVKELNQVTDYVDYRGKTPPKVAEGIFLVTAKNIKNGKIDYTNSKEYVPVESYKSIMSRGLPKIGDVLITTEAPLGEIASIDKENIALAQRIIKYRGHNNVLRNDYLKYSLLSPYFQEGLDKDSTGSTVKGIKGSRLHKQKILIPPIPEQQKIATILSTVDEKIEVIEEQIKETETLKKGLMQQLLTKGIGHTKFKDSSLGEIPESWEVVRLEKICTLQGGFAFKSIDSSDKGIRWLKIANVSINKILWDDESFLPDNYDKKFTDFVLNEGDIVLAMTRPILSGKLKIARILFNDKGALLNQRVGRIKVKGSNEIDYVFQILNSSSFIESLNKELLGTDPPNISSTMFEGIEVPLPNILEQKKIAEILNTIDEKLESVLCKKDKFQELKKGLMQQLLTGKMRVNIN